MVLMPIDMPKNCVIDCPCWDENALSECQILHKGEEDYEGVDPLTERLPDCPLIEMHTHKVMSMSEQELKEFRKYINGDWEITSVDK